MYYLYVKTHVHTGLKYLGQTSRSEVNRYKGSGKYWKKHLRKHGNEVNTEILKECVSMDEIKHWGEHYSDLWNIVNSKEWANLKKESGDGGGLVRHSEETKQKMRKTRSAESRANMSRLHIRPTKGMVWINNGIEEKFVKEVDILKGWNLGRLLTPVPPSQKGKVWATNGIENRMVTIIPEGWRKGRTKMVRPVGIEPTTSGFRIPRSTN